ncbi:hypothetical protein ACTFIV_007313 [Dictyostelium citrinum]
MLGIKRNLSDSDDRVNDENIDNNSNNNDISNKRFKTNSISFEKKSNQSSTSSTTSSSTSKIPLGSQKRINITSFSGHRITRVVKSQNTENISTSLSKSNILFNDLLKKPIKEILEEIENIESLKLKSDLIKNSNSLTPTKSKGIDNNEDIVKNKDNRLWVDKYAPTSFHDLLSDTTMNLEVLNWLELWDHVVFDKPLQKNLVMPSTFNSNNNNNNSAGGYMNKFNSKFTTSSNSNHQHQNQGQYLLQEDGTPIAKIILLTGGPGLGKTTLAHVLAKQANYNPVEINASEDRSGEAFESKLLSAIEMKSLFNDNKPNCLIIDEIDGISGRDNGPIELLIKLIDNSLKLGNIKKSTSNPAVAAKKSGKDTESDDDDDDDQEEEEDEDIDEKLPNDQLIAKTKGKKGKKKGFKTRLLRPIICICNDQYVPSLRKLRQKAMVFDFQAPKKNELLSRLKVICSNEGLTATDTTLNSLIDMTGSDIRSCINSLQFIKSKTSVLNSELLKNKSNIVIGQKDMEKGLVEIWNNIFKSSSTNSSNVNKLSKYTNFTTTPTKKSIEFSGGNDNLNQLDFQIGACNQVDKLIDGVYENYLTNMSSDYTMEKTMDCLDWMVFGDQMLNVHADEKYRSLVPLAIHQRCTTYSPKIQLPHSDYDNFIKKKSTSNIKDSFYSDLPATIYSYLTKKCFVIDFIYPFVDILSLPVRVTNVQLYSQTEKINLNRLVEIMKFYRLSYKLEKVNTFIKHHYQSQKKLVDSLDDDDEEIRNKKQQQQQQTQQTQDQTMQYKLEPPIDTLLYFQNQDTKAMVKHIRLSHSQKQIISTAVQQYKPPQKSTTTVNNDENQKQQKDQLKKQTTVTTKEEFKKPLVPTVLKDFFGRVIQTSPETKKKTMGPTLGPNIKYRFQEGFTNAVKKTVYVKDFL